MDERSRVAAHLRAEIEKAFADREFPAEPPPGFKESYRDSFYRTCSDVTVQAARRHTFHLSFRDPEYFVRRFFPRYSDALLWLVEQGSDDWFTLFEDLKPFFLGYGAALVFESWNQAQQRCASILFRFIAHLSAVDGTYSGLDLVELLNAAWYWELDAEAKRRDRQGIWTWQAERVREELRTTFPLHPIPVRPPGGHAIEVEDAYRMMGGCRWTDISIDTLESNFDGFNYTDSEEFFDYYLPAYLDGVLRLVQEGRDWWTFFDRFMRFVVYHGPEIGYHQWPRERQKCLARFLRLVAEFSIIQWPEPDEDVKNLILTEWYWEASSQS